MNIKLLSKSEKMCDLSVQHKEKKREKNTSSVPKKVLRAEQITKQTKKYGKMTLKR